jgi:hypothetical protein
VLHRKADRLTTRAIEQVRGHSDRCQLGLILISMPGIEKSLAPCLADQDPDSSGSSMPLMPCSSSALPDPAEPSIGTDRRRATRIAAQHGKEVVEAAGEALVSVSCDPQRRHQAPKQRRH